MRDHRRRARSGVNGDFPVAPLRVGRGDRQTARLDAAPAAGAFLKATSRIQSGDARIARIAAAQALDELPPVDKVRTLFNYVAGLKTRPAPATQSALASLDGGNDSGKSRL